MKTANWMMICAATMLIPAGAVSAQSNGGGIGAYTSQETLVRSLDAKPATPVFSGDGNHFAYVTTKDGKKCVSLDGKAGPEYQDVTNLALNFDGKHLAFSVPVGNRSTVMVDGKPGMVYDAIHDILFSPDGRHLAFIAQNSRDWFVVADGRQSAAYGNVKSASISYSSNSQHLVYRAPIGLRSSVFVDGNPLGSYQLMGKGPFVSPDGAHVAFEVRSGNKTSNSGAKWVLIVNGQTGPAYDKILENSLVYSLDGKHFAYAVENENIWYFVIDGGQGQPFSGGNYLPLNAAWKRQAYITAKTDKPLVVFNGQAGDEYDAITDLVFSADGKHFAYTGQKGGKYVEAVDGAPGKTYDEIADVTFSRDGKAMAYEARAGKNWIVVLNGQPGAKYNNIGPPIFSANDVLDYLAVKQDSLYNVECTPAGVNAEGGAGEH